MDVNLADAKARLSELVARAATGEPVRITRRGRLVARIVPAAATRAPIDVDALARLTTDAPTQSESAGDLVRRMRDGDRY